MERTIDGYSLWTGAEKMGTDADWVGTIGVKGSDGELAVHSLDGPSFRSAIAADEFAKSRLREVVGVGADMELLF